MRIAYFICAFLPCAAAQAYPNLDELAPQGVYMVGRATYNLDLTRCIEPSNLPQFLKVKFEIRGKDLFASTSLRAKKAAMCRRLGYGAYTCVTSFDPGIKGIGDVRQVVSYANERMQVNLEIYARNGQYCVSQFN